MIEEKELLAEGIMLILDLHTLHRQTVVIQEVLHHLILHHQEVVNLPEVLHHHIALHLVEIVEEVLQLQVVEVVVVAVGTAEGLHHQVQAVVVLLVIAVEEEDN